MCFRVYERDGSPASRVTRSLPLVVTFFGGWGIGRVAGIERVVGTPDDVDERGWWVGLVVRARRGAALFRTRILHRHQTGNCSPLSKPPHRDTVAGRTARR